MCGCMYMYMYVCICAYIYIYTYIHIHTHIHTHTCMHACMHTHIHTYTHIHITYYTIYIFYTYTYTYTWGRRTSRGRQCPTPRRVRFAGLRGCLLEPSGGAGPGACRSAYEAFDRSGRGPSARPQRASKGNPCPTANPEPMQRGLLFSTRMPLSTTGYGNAEELDGVVRRYV